MFACVDAYLKNVRITSLDITHKTYHILGRKQTTSIALGFQNSFSFKFIPPLNILTVPDWLNVKCH